MRKLLLLDADVIIDLHVLGLFEKLAKAYEIFVTLEVLRKARHYKKQEKFFRLILKRKLPSSKMSDLTTLIVSWQRPGKHD